MRATTRTTLVLGQLLEIPVGVCAAIDNQDVKFDTAGPDGEKRVQQFVHPTLGRRMLPLGDGGVDDALEGAIDDMIEFVPDVVDETIKGIRVGDSFLVVPPSELEFADAATVISRVELLEVIDYRKVPTDRLTASYWIQADEGFAGPLGVLIAAMRREGTAMLVKWSARSRQRLGVIRVRRTPEGDALLLNNIAFADQWKAPDNRVLEPGAIADVDPKAVDAACEILRAFHGRGDALDETFDELPAMLKAIIETAASGVYADQVKTLERVALYVKDGQVERAARLHTWAEEQWSELDEKRQEVEEAIAAGGDGIGERLAAIVG